MIVQSIDHSSLQVYYEKVIRTYALVIFYSLQLVLCQFLHLEIILIFNNYISEILVNFTSDQWERTGDAVG